MVTKSFKIVKMSTIVMVTNGICVLIIFVKSNHLFTCFFAAMLIQERVTHPVPLMPYSLRDLQIVSSMTKSCAYDRNQNKKLSSSEEKTSFQELFFEVCVKSLLTFPVNPFVKNMI